MTFMLNFVYLKSFLKKINAKNDGNCYAIRVFIHNQLPSLFFILIRIENVVMHN